MTTVSIKKAVYDDMVIKPIVYEMLQSMGDDAIGPGTKVLIKPNFLSPAKPEKAVTTHPLIVKAAALYALEKGAKVQISDSPAMGGFDRLLKVGGYKEELKSLGVDLKPFDASVKVDIGEPFGRIDIAKDAMEADVVINLAKVKTHAQMILTLGVKNMFGCIVGMKKPEWHLKAGEDKEMFARLIVGIHEAVAPAYTIVDGILAMEGHGPGKAGTPRELGLLLGGDNAHAVDKVICTLLGKNPDELYTHSQARKMGVYSENMHISGDMNIIYDFAFPDLGSLNIGPGVLNRFFRTYVIQKPVGNNKECKLCGECWKICPKQAITHNIKGISFDYNACIRCYCCLEVCPFGVIKAKKPLLGKIAERF